MKASTLAKIFGALYISIGPIQAQEVQTGVGFPMNFDIGYGVMTHEGSSLVRKWLVVNDPGLPVSLDTTGFKGIESVPVQGGWQYRASVKLKVAQPIVAVRITITPFDIWDSSGRPLALSTIKDMAVGTETLDGVWYEPSEGAALDVLTSFVYIDRVRLSDGTIVLADTDFVLEEARKLSSGLQQTDISPGTTAPAP